MRILKKILIGSRNLLLFLFVSSLLAVVAYKFIPVYYTPLMFIRVYEQVRDSKPIKLEHKWIEANCPAIGTGGRGFGRQSFSRP